MSDAEPWPETIPFAPPGGRHDTLTMVAALEYWRLDDPIRRTAVVAARGLAITATISLAMGEHEPPREWTISFGRPLPTPDVLSLLDALIRTAPGGPPVAVPPEDRR